MSDIIYEINYY